MRLQVQYEGDPSPTEIFPGVSLRLKRDDGRTVVLQFEHLESGVRRAAYTLFDVVTVREPTPAEADAAETALVASVSSAALGKALKAAFEMIFALANVERQRHGDAALTLAQFKGFADTLNAINGDAYRAWLKDLQ